MLRASAWPRHGLGDHGVPLPIQPLSEPPLNTAPIPGLATPFPGLPLFRPHLFPPFTLLLALQIHNLSLPLLPTDNQANNLR